MNQYLWKKIGKTLLTLLGVSLLIFALFSLMPEDPAACVLAKPVIYLYPEQETDVTVHLALDGELTAAYPAYDDSWHITAQPDGTLNDKSGRQYYCLYWEGISPVEFDMSCGFVVPGVETAAFLEKALAQLGLTEKESNEFIIYWLPLMQDTPFNLITFQSEAYTRTAALHIDPAPDTLIRVFMAWKPLNQPVELRPQVLTAPERRGFTAVEWGGTRIS